LEGCYEWLGHRIVSWPTGSDHRSTEPAVGPLRRVHARSHGWHGSRGTNISRQHLGGVAVVRPFHSEQSVVCRFCGGCSDAKRGSNRASDALVDRPLDSNLRDSAVRGKAIGSCALWFRLWASGDSVLIPRTGSHRASASPRSGLLFRWKGFPSDYNLGSSFGALGQGRPKLRVRTEM